MTAEFGAPVDVLITHESNTNGVTILNIPLGAVFKYLRETAEWSKEDYVGPVLVVKPRKRDDYLDIQLFNRRSIYNIKITFYRNSGYHRKDNIIMVRSRDGNVYGLASNNDYLEQFNKLEVLLKEFVTTPSMNELSLDSIDISNGESIRTPENRTPTPLSPVYHPTTNNGISSPFGKLFPTPASAGYSSVIPPFQSSVSSSTIISKPEPLKFVANPTMIPASVYRRAATDSKNGRIRCSSTTPVTSYNNERPHANTESAGNHPFLTQLFSQASKEEQTKNLPESIHANIKSKAHLFNSPVGTRMNAITELVNFSYREGIKKGTSFSGADNPILALMNLPNDQLVHTLETILNVKPVVKARLLDRLTNSNSK